MTHLMLKVTVTVIDIYSGSNLFDFAVNYLSIETFLQDIQL